MSNFPSDHPLRHAAAEFYAADAAYRRMLEVSVGSFVEYEQAWREFLRRVERIYGKTRAASRNLPQWQPINSRVHQLREKDPLLLYVRQARNADEHTIQDVASDWQPEPYAVPIGDGAVEVHFKHGDRPLLPVTVRGVTYEPARAHLGASFADSLGKGRDEPAIVAEMTLSFYAEFINEVSRTVFPALA